MKLTPCRPNTLDRNEWCLKDLFSYGEGFDLIAIPSTVWNQLKGVWLNLNNGASESPKKVLAAQEGSPLVSYQYNAPETLSTLFPTGFPTDVALYFKGNALIFNPTVGNAIEANGVPYQQSTISIPIGSDMYYDMFAQFMQSKSWVFLKLSYDNQILHVYGGPRGYFPVADEIAEMMYSGNNDSKGMTTLSFSQPKAQFTIEYIENANNIDSPNALPDLFKAIQANICKPTATNNNMQGLVGELKFSTVINGGKINGKNIIFDPVEEAGVTSIQIYGEYSDQSQIDILNAHKGENLFLNGEIELNVQAIPTCAIAFYLNELDDNPYTTQFEPLNQGKHTFTIAIDPLPDVEIKKFGIALVSQTETNGTVISYTNFVLETKM